MIDIKNEYKSKLNNISFIDLFCGIGGFRLALESFGAECLFSIDNNKQAVDTYDTNFNSNSYGDITKLNEINVPKHDILCAGFPCQSFSISGKQKGFEDTRGTLFFDVVRIADYHKPKILFLENVGNLKNHDKGRTFKIIKNTLRSIGYNVYYDILNASNFGVPQARKRIYIIAIRKDIDNHNFKFPQETNELISIKNILLPNEECEDLMLKKEYDLDLDKVKKFNKIQNRPLRIGTVNKGGQGDRIYSENGHAITLSAEGGGNGARTGLYYIDKKIRKLHPRETARLMGFPEDYILNPSINQAHKQFGNSVIVDMIQYITKEIVNDGSVFNEC
ncbi:MAG: DNA cytosine methyltransferase [Methanobrevibacter smithii]